MSGGRLIQWSSIGLCSEFSFQNNALSLQPTAFTAFTLLSVLGVVENSYSFYFNLQSVMDRESIVECMILTVFSVQCLVFRVQYSAFSVQWSVFCVQCSVFQCSVFSVQCSVFSVQCTLCSVQCSVVRV